jgi:hypothetical protein
MTHGYEVPFRVHPEGHIPGPRLDDAAAGPLSFGLVNIPVKLYNATSLKTVRPHHFERPHRPVYPLPWRRRRAAPSRPTSRPPSWAAEGEPFENEPRPSSEEPSAHPESSGADADEDAPVFVPCSACSVGRRMAAEDRGARRGKGSR